MRIEAVLDRMLRLLGRDPFLHPRPHGEWRASSELEGRLINVVREGKVWVFEGGREGFGGGIGLHGATAEWAIDISNDPSQECKAR